MEDQNEDLYGVLDSPQDDKPKRRKANDIEVTERKADAIKMLLNLHNNSEIREHLMTTYGIKEHAARFYIVEAHKEIAKTYKPKLATVVNANLKKYSDIARRTEIDDPKVCIMALNAMEKLLKLTGPASGPQFNTQINLNLEQVETQELLALLGKIQVNPDDDIIEITDEEDQNE